LSHAPAQSKGSFDLFVVGFLTVLGLELRASSLDIFEIVSRFLPRVALNHNPPISASQVARITGLSLWCLARAARMEESVLDSDSSWALFVSAPGHRT
jgi:hypothetical protein